MRTHNKSELELTKHTPYLARTGEPWGVFYILEKINRVKTERTVFPEQSHSPLCLPVE